MCAQFSNWLYRVTSGWVALLALAVALLCSALVLPSVADSAGAASGGAGTPDLTPVYSASDLYRWAEAYGEDGRAAYVRARFTFDLVWPLVYALFLTTAITWLLGRSLAPENGWRLANLVPTAGALLDYLENVSASVVMLRYPNRTPIIAEVAPVFSLLKWIAIAGSFLLLVAGVVLVVRDLSGRRSSA